MKPVGRVAAAHSSKAVMSLCWKPPSAVDDGNASGGWLASAGLDKTAKVRRVLMSNL